MYLLKSPTTHLVLCLSSDDKGNDKKMAKTKIMFCQWSGLKIRVSVEEHISSGPTTHLAPCHASEDKDLFKSPTTHLALCLASDDKDKDKEKDKDKDETMFCQLSGLRIRVSVEEHRIPPTLSRFLSD